MSLKISLLLTLKKNFFLMCIRLASSLAILFGQLYSLAHKFTQYLLSFTWNFFFIFLPLCDFFFSDYVCWMHVHVLCRYYYIVCEVAQSCL